MPKIPVQRLDTAANWTTNNALYVGLTITDYRDDINVVETHTVTQGDIDRLDRFRARETQRQVHRRATERLATARILAASTR